MKVLLLSPYPEALIEKINETGDDCIVYNNKISLDFIKENRIEFLISYGYRTLISKDIIDYLNLSILNLHIGFLPFNKGAYPNLWAHIENTHSGVTIHRISVGIDEGDILIREKIFIDPKINTLKSSYYLLRKEIEMLFIENWDKLRKKELIGFKQDGEGSFHSKKEGDKIIKNLVNGWDTKISDLKDNLLERF